MPRFFFNLIDGRRVVDDEGQEFSCLDDAKEEAVTSARSIMREAVWTGKLPLSESIEIADDKGEILATVAFKDTVEIE